MDILKLALLCDVDFAGDDSGSESTSGVFVGAAGPTTYLPIATLSKKQGRVSTHMRESEIVAEMPTRWTCGKLFSPSLLRRNSHDRVVPNPIGSVRKPRLLT